MTHPIFSNKLHIFVGHLLHCRLIYYNIVHCNVIYQLITTLLVITDASARGDMARFTGTVSIGSLSER